MKDFDQELWNGIVWIAYGITDGLQLGSADGVERKYYSEKWSSIFISYSNEDGCVLLINGTNHPIMPYKIRAKL